MHAYVTSEEFLGTKLSSNLICAGSQGSIMCIKNPYLSCMHIFWSTRLGFSWQGSRKSWGRPCSIADLIMTAAKAQAILRQNVEPRNIELEQHKHKHKHIVSAAYQAFLLQLLQLLELHHTRKVVRTLPHQGWYLATQPL
jgi:hypothetical protein